MGEREREKEREKESDVFSVIMQMKREWGVAVGAGSFVIDFLLIIFLP